MREKLERLENKYNELTELLSRAEIIADQERFQKYARAHAELIDIVAAYQAYKKAGLDLAAARGLLASETDEEFKTLLQEEIAQNTALQEQLEQEIKLLLLPRDPNDGKNVIMEIRAGTGGEEAALFAGDLYRMYSRYAERQGWRTEIMDSNYTELGGIKELTFVVEGTGVYSRMKFESGVHRVQRIPATESGGRIHTSAATVAVLPEAEEIDCAINPNDLKIDVYCASGPGGQCVNTTQSAVRITHLPSGLVVTCQDEKSQHKNKAQALRVLRSRLKEKLTAQQNSEMAGNRRSQVGSGDRSERIRTYNFPQGRVTDHRINLTLHKLDMILEGQLQDIVEALVASDNAERLRDAQ
jgi:peptide chain release factor 1